MEQEELLKQYAGEVLRLVNEERKSRGLPVLRWSGALCQVAGIRAEEILAGYYSHRRPDGTDCGDLLDSKGLHWQNWGENLADGQKSPEEVVHAWMASGTHRENILNPAFRFLGVCVKENGNRLKWVEIFFR